MPRWLIAIVLMSGCAFSLSGPAPNRPHNEIPKCDTTKGLVVLDGLMATAAGVTALGIIGADGGAAALLPLAIGGLYVAGAVHGSRAVDECRSEIGIFEANLAARETLPPPREDDEPRPRSAAVDMPPQPRPIPMIQPPPPQPPQQQPPAPPPPQKKPPPPQPEPSDDWSDFWREVP